MKNLSTIAKFCGCTFTEEMPNIRKHIDVGYVAETLDYFYRRYGSDVVLYGGQAATPWFYGYTRLRYHTTDIDLAVKDNRIEQVVRDNELQYHSIYNVFVTYMHDIMCVFSSGEVHNWTIPDDFFTSSLPIHFGAYRAQVCAREYLIAQKFRRGYFSEEKLFGKDALDILNILTAPHIRDDLTFFDIEKTGKLSVELTGPDLPDSFSILRHFFEHLAPKYRQFADREVSRLERAIREVLQ